MAYDVQQRDISILGQRVKELKIRASLLNEKMQPMDVLQGDLISGSITISATDDIRRTANFSFFLKNKSYIASETGKIWFNKYVSLSLGIVNLKTNQIQYYPLGLYMFSDNSYTYDSTNNVIEVKCKDLMFKLLNVPLYGAETYKILAGTVIRDAMISVVSQLGGFKKYLIGNIGAEVGAGTNSISEVGYDQVPYDLTFSSSDTAYSVLTRLRDLYAGWESFFDEDTFVCQKIPTGKNERIVLDWETIVNKQLVINESRNNSLDKVKNITQVFGKQIVADRYTDVCTKSGSEYTATFTSLTALTSGEIYAVKLPSSNFANPTLKINSLGSYPIVDSSEVPIMVGKINGYSAFKFYHNKMIYLGDYQVKALAVHVSSMPSAEKKQYYETKFNTNNIVYIVNPDSPYTVERIGELIDVKSGNDFGNIYSQDLALQRARYENYKTTRLEDTITIDMQLVPWLTVNRLISYKSKIYDTVDTYMIKNISITLSAGTMQIECVKYYPLYPDVV